MAAPSSVEEPFPIFKLAHRYLLYDVNTVSYIRREYNICGVLIGGLSQAPQQNVFLGLPLELMPEEARLLVERGVAHVVDDVKTHKHAFLRNGLSVEERRAFQTALRKQGVGAAREAGKRTDERKKAALKDKLGVENWNDIPEDMLKPSRARTDRETVKNRETETSRATENDEEALFASPDDSLAARPGGGQSRHAPAVSTSDHEPFAITPTTSYPPLQTSASESDAALVLPDVPRSYALFRYLHNKGYFLSPGLRFGCQYMAYPGDPLRFHSHFLCNGMDWDEEFDLIDLVGGGRLGTGVKKGFLVGGHADAPHEGVADGEEENGENNSARAFCIEWGGM